jgi:hypothetical protein
MGRRHHQESKNMSEIKQNGRDDQSDLVALRELLIEMIEATQRRVITYRVDLATTSCKGLVQKVIRHRGERAAAVFHTKLGAELARRGKGRVLLQRAVRNGNGPPVNA